MLEERIDQEMVVLRHYYPTAVYIGDGRWVRIPGYPLPVGWNRPSTDVVFQVGVSYPGAPPYGIYVAAGLLYNGVRPNNYSEPAGTQPPFDGSWGIFSWQPEDGQWRPASTVSAGTNLLTWARGFADRFAEGV